jgi:hypothetical protein
MIKHIVVDVVHRGECVARQMANSRHLVALAPRAEADGWW